MINAAADTTSRAYLQARRLELDRHPAPPAGDEVHAGGIFYETQKGDSLHAIAREHSQAYHMSITPQALVNSNQGVLRDGLQPGDRLVVPGLVPRTDAFIHGLHPRLEEVAGELQHRVASGQTLSGIARHYARTEGLALDATALHAANRELIGPDADTIQAGQVLRIPGVTFHSPAASLPTLRALDSDIVASLARRVQHEDGSVENVTIAKLVADTGGAVYAGRSADAAVQQLHEAVAEGDRGTSALIQARGGAFWIVPVGYEPAGEVPPYAQLLSDAFRSESRSLLAMGQRNFVAGGVTVRRYDE